MSLSSSKSNTCINNISVKKELNEKLLQVIARRNSYARVLYYLSENPDSSITEVAEGCGISYPQAQQILQELRKEGIVVVKLPPENNRHKYNLNFRKLFEQKESDE